MTILAPHTASQVRNAALSALHFIAYEHQCEVPDILALITPSQQPSQAPAARVSELATPDTQAEVSAPQTSADHSPETAHDILGGLPVAAAESNAEETGQEGGPANTATGKSGEASASPAPVKRTRTKGRGKVVEASIRGNPDWTDLMHAEHLGIDPAYIRRTAVRLGLKLASRLSLRKAKQAATTEALKAAPAKPQEPVERAGAATPRPEPKQPPAAMPAKRVSIKQQVTEVHAEHPDWTAKEIAAHIDAKIGTVSSALADVTSEERLAARAAEQAEIDRRLIAEARQREEQRKALVPAKDGRTLTERVRALHQQHPTWTARLIANELGANPNSVSALLAGIRNPKAAPKPEKPEFTSRRQMVEHYGEIAKRLGKPS